MPFPVPSFTRRTSLNVFPFQITTAPSAEADASSAPSFDHATAVTVVSCPARSAMPSPLPAPHTSTGHLPSHFSWRIIARRLPSGCHATPAVRRTGFFSAAGGPPIETSPLAGGRSGTLVIFPVLTASRSPLGENARA